MEHQKLLKKVGERIRSERKKKGWTIQDLAHSCDLEKSNLVPIEQGKRNITLKTLAKIAEALEIQVKELL